MASDKTIRVEVAYARPDEQVIIPVDVPEDATLEDAVRLSRIVERFPEIDPAVADVGIFGKVAKRTAGLRPGDRVEIYRPLIADPKEVRKQRARESKPVRDKKPSA